MANVPVTYERSVIECAIGNEQYNKQGKDTNLIPSVLVIFYLNFHFHLSDWF